MVAAGDGDRNEQISKKEIEITTYESHDDRWHAA